MTGLGSRLPSERGADPDQPERRGIGLFRLARWGWPVTIVLAATSVGIVVYGIMRADPVGNPPPAGYVGAACGAFGELQAAAAALPAAIEGDPAARASAEAAGIRASEIGADLPEWAPGEPFNELLGELIISTLNAVDAVDRARSSDSTDEQRAAAAAEAAEEADRSARLVRDGRQALAERRYNFDCE